MNHIRTFNTSGPNILSQHYTLLRPALIAKGLDMVHKQRYFTIWSPRQAGKTTYFQLLAKELRAEGYKVCYINFEDYLRTPVSIFLNTLCQELQKAWGISFPNVDISEVFQHIGVITGEKFVLIIDEVDGINPEYFGTFLHAIRNVYHKRENHSLKSVILVGVSNLTGTIEGNASPFNTNDNLKVPYFTNAEIYELLGQHETETGQLFSTEVKEKIAHITSGQPGLVCGFGYNLVENYPDVPVFEFEHYLEIEKNYVFRYLDKNVANVVSKAKKHRKFAERLLFETDKIPFNIYDERIKELNINGLITFDKEDYVVFEVLLYRKCLHAAFTAPLNGESKEIRKRIEIEDYFTPATGLDIDKIIQDYQAYAKRRGFRYFIEHDADGNPTGLKEAALVYSFETYIQSFLVAVEGKSYLEPHVALGRSDLIVNVQGVEFVIEAKIFRDSNQFAKGKLQLAYYVKSLGLSTGIYLVFADTETNLKSLVEKQETIDEVNISTYIVRYDIEKDFADELRKSRKRDD